MSDIIKLLPDNIANQIAAGEVVQRPASVVKELMENSVDAGARNVRLIIKNAGKTLIQVIDDGCGMSETDARMCFERHATSKISKLNDLYQIHTLGFRGEAMASIAAVAQVELKTRRTIDEVGVIVLEEDSVVVRHEPCACQAGTSIAVKNLFFNVPARRNFLKSNTVEMRHITDEFLRVALAYPELGFSLNNDGEDIYHLKGGTLKARIVSLFGKKYEEMLVPVEETTDALTIKGYVGKPEVARKTRGEQFFFANGRFIRSPYLYHAVANAFENLLPADSFPFFAIYLTLPADRIDINVHPTKTEIKFTNEKLVYAILRSAVKKSLGQYHIAPALDFESESTMPIGGYSEPGNRISIDPFPRMPSSSPEPREREWTPRSEPFRQRASQGEWEELYKVLQTKAEPAAPASTSGLPGAVAGGEEDEEEPVLLTEVAESKQKPVLQMQAKYLVTTIRSGLMIIHQQLAHERILFERYLSQLGETQAFSQRLLFPEVINVQPAEFALLKPLLADIMRLGIELEEFGKNAFVLNGLPPDLQNHDPKKVVENILEEFKQAEGLENLDPHEKLARALAKNASIKVGRVLAAEEMARLIDELFACRMPYYSPDGKPALITVAADELDKKFKRT